MKPHLDYPESKPCTMAADSGGKFICLQGMVLEEGFHTVSGTPLEVSRLAYRCQDCGTEEIVRLGLIKHNHVYPTPNIFIKIWRRIRNA